MNERTCTTCGRWQPVPSRAFGTCEASRTRGNDEDQFNRPAWVAVVDVGGVRLGSVLVTRPEFGCAEWVSETR